MKLPKELNMKTKMWDTVLLWSGYDGYYSISEIAKNLGEKRSTIISRLKRFAAHYPKSYEKISNDRAAIKASTLRLGVKLSKPVSFQSNMETHIKEKF
jgi:IS30 family transposase